MINNNLDDPYEILGVPYDATEADIKKAYRQATLKYNPSRQQTEEEKEKAHELFDRISDAFATLNDPEQRDNWRMMNKAKIMTQGGGGGGEGVDDDDDVSDASSVGHDDNDEADTTTNTTNDDNKKDDKESPISDSKDTKPSLTSAEPDSLSTSLWRFLYPLRNEEKKFYEEQDKIEEGGGDDGADEGEENIKSEEEEDDEVDTEEDETVAVAMEKVEEGSSIFFNPLRNEEKKFYPESNKEEEGEIRSTEEDKALPDTEEDSSIEEEEQEHEQNVEVALLSNGMAQVNEEKEDIVPSSLFHPLRNEEKNFYAGRNEAMEEQKKEKDDDGTIDSSQQISRGGEEDEEEETYGPISQSKPQFSIKDIQKLEKRISKRISSPETGKGKKGKISKKDKKAKKEDDESSCSISSIPEKSQSVPMIITTTRPDDLRKTKSMRVDMAGTLHASNSALPGDSFMDQTDFSYGAGTVSLTSSTNDDLDWDIENQTAISRVPGSVSVYNASQRSSRMPYNASQRSSRTSYNESQRSSRTPYNASQRSSRTSYNASQRSSRTSHNASQRSSRTSFLPTTKLQDLTEEEVEQNEQICRFASVGCACCCVLVFGILSIVLAVYVFLVADYV